MEFVWRDGLGSGRAVARMSEDWDAPRRWASSSRERLFDMVALCFVFVAICGARFVTMCPHTFYNTINYVFNSYFRKNVFSKNSNKLSL